RESGARIQSRATLSAGTLSATRCERPLRFISPQDKNSNVALEDIARHLGFQNLSASDKLRAKAACAAGAAQLDESELRLWQSPSLRQMLFQERQDAIKRRRDVGRLHFAIESVTPARHGNELVW